MHPSVFSPSGRVLAAGVSFLPWIWILSMLLLHLLTRSCDFCLSFCWHSECSLLVCVFCSGFYLRQAFHHASWFQICVTEINPRWVDYFSGVPLDSVCGMLLRTLPHVHLWLLHCSLCVSVSGRQCGNYFWKTKLDTSLSLLVAWSRLRNAIISSL